MSSDTNTIPGFNKKKRDVRKVLAISMKPPGLVEDEESGDVETSVVFVNRNSQEVRMPCTEEVYRRVEGRAKKGKAHPGMDNKIHHQFLIAVEGKGLTQKAVSVDTIPKIEPRTANRADQEEVEFLEVKIVQATGEIDVTVVPPKVTMQTVTRMLASIDKVDNLYPGLELEGGFLVQNVIGNKITIDPVVE